MESAIPPTSNAMLLRASSGEDERGLPGLQAVQAGTGELRLLPDLNTDRRALKRAGEGLRRALRKHEILVPPSGAHLLLQQIVKLNCERCRLRTEHYVQIRDGTLLVCRCLSCGQTRRNLVEEDRSYPSDDRRPMYVS